MADEYYTPNPNFYSDLIKEQEKLRKNLDKASYDSTKRGFVINGKVYTQKQIDATYAAIDKKIAGFKKEEKKYGKYGPGWGDSAKSNAAGVEYEKLRKAAEGIEVTDYASAIANLKAWKAVNDFVARNRDIKVATNVPAIVQGERGRNTRGSILHAVSVDESWDARNIEEAQNAAIEYAEKDTTKVESVLTYGRAGGGNSTYKNVKTVTNQQLLDTRLAEIDSVNSTFTPRTPTESPRPGVDAPTGTEGQPATAGAKGGQSGMNEKQTMKAYAGFTVKPGTGSNAGANTGTGTGSGTGTGAGTGAGTGTGGKTVGAKVPKNWEAKFREMFPTKTWMLDLDRSKYADVFKVLQDGVKNQAWLTPESQQRFLGQLDNTSFIKELAQTDMVRQVKAVVGDLGFDSVPFNSFLTKAMNMGWKDDVLKQEVYKEAFRKNDQGAFVNPTALARAKASNDYLSVKKIGTSYFSNIDDATIQQSLTGGLTLEDVERQQRELAKTKYSHLSGLLDQGFTLDSLTSSFKQQAAQLLEKDINSIDMSQADYEQVINAGEEGKKRMMTTGEWEIKLRSDPRYNWGSTQNAKEEARRLSASISQAFGKVI
jgi:hypothetical protein